MGIVASASRRHSSPINGKKQWRWYRKALRVLMIAFAIISLLFVIIVSLQLLMRWSGAVVEGPHSYLVINTFGYITVMCLYYTASFSRWKPTINPRVYKWLVVAFFGTIFHLFMITVMTIVCLINQAQTCGDIVCAISGFEVIAYIAFFVIILTAFMDAATIWIIILIGRLTRVVRGPVTCAVENIREMERDEMEDVPMGVDESGDGLTDDKEGATFVV